MRTLLDYVIVGAFAAVSLGTMPSSAAQTADWSSYLRGPRHSSDNRLATAITPVNASGLVEDWSFIDPGPTAEGQPEAGFNASPTVVNGVIYIGSNTGVFYALDEGTGAVLWQRLLGYTMALSCGYGRGITSTAAVAIDPVSETLTVYVGGGDGYLYALNAATGEIVWSHLVLQIGTTENSGYLWGSPTILNGTIYLGMSSQCDHPLVRGGLKAFDMHSGALRRTYWTTPSGTVGASVWTSAAADKGSLWLTVGNGMAGDSFAILRLSTSLRFESEWIVPGTVGTDLDWGSSPTLFEATLDGVRTRMVGANQKNGFFYALDAIDLAKGPVWSLQVGVEGDLGTVGICLAAAVWDSADKQLFVGSNQTTIQSQVFAGSMRSLDPATGAILWETGLAAGPVMGSPSSNGDGVLAAGTYNLLAQSENAVYLLSASDGTILTTIPEISPVFAQPVFADTRFFVATSGGILHVFTPSSQKTPLR